MSNWLRPHAVDKVEVTIFKSEVDTDEDGNDIAAETDETTSTGWDIQPISASQSAEFGRAGEVVVGDTYRAFVPPSELEHLTEGVLIRDESNGRMYRVGAISDWKSHIEVLLEPSK